MKCTSQLLEGTNPALQDICSHVVQYLNEKAFKNFKPAAKKTISLIKQRLSEGYTESDFYKVIDNKVYEWLGKAEYEQYLRPITLFGDSFDGYLNDEPIRLGTDWKSMYY